MLESVGLADRCRRSVRLVLARHEAAPRHRWPALLGDPTLLVLDEPANGLDPVGMSEMRELFGRLASEDRTVWCPRTSSVSSSSVSDWLLIIDGRLRYAGDAAGFSGAAAPEIILAPGLETKTSSPSPTS